MTVENRSLTRETGSVHSRGVSFLTAIIHGNRIGLSYEEPAMPRTFPADLNQFIQDELETGDYANEDALLTAALEVFREVRQRHAELRSRVQESVAQARAGEATPLNMDETKQKLLNRLAQQKD
jgi:Arc/MetJ-type ribon-helix-helix transcriptional regulator